MVKVREVSPRVLGLSEPQKLTIRTPKGFTKGRKRKESKEVKKKPEILPSLSDCFSWCWCLCAFCGLLRSGLIDSPCATDFFIANFDRRWGRKKHGGLDGSGNLGSHGRGAAGGDGWPSVEGLNEAVAKGKQGEQKRKKSGPGRVVMGLMSSSFATGAHRRKLFSVPSSRLMTLVSELVGCWVESPGNCSSREKRPRSGKPGGLTGHRDAGGMQPGQKRADRDHQFPAFLQTVRGIEDRRFVTRARSRNLKAGASGRRGF